MPSRLIYYLYWFVQVLALPFILGYFFYRGLRDPKYFRQFHHRFGYLPFPFKRTAHAAIWLHGVSVGEVVSAAPLLRRFKQEMPYAPLFVSCTTIAGKSIALQRLGDLVDGIFFAPLDFRMAVRGVLRTIRPQLVIVMETEIWPNLYREVKRSGAGLVIVNGRISDRAIGRYRLFRWFFRHALRWPDAILVQSDRDRDRYLEIGANGGQVRNAGNLKYDLLPPQLPLSAELLELLRAGSPVWIAASTMAPARPGDVHEEEVVLDAFEVLAKEFPKLLLVLAPRKPERFDEVAAKLSTRPISFQRRSDLDGSLERPGVLLLDSMGELASLFPYADAVFMGGTLADRGGHNILEPALAGRAVVAGPHMENFEEIAREFTLGGGLLRIGDASELADVTRELLASEAKRRETGERARALTEARRGATATALQVCREAYECAVPHVPPIGPLRPLLSALALLWKRGAARKQRRNFAELRKLDVPVVSVGGIVMGGAGKTPFVLWLAQFLRERGRKPAILTRGYKRQSPEKILLLEQGGAAPASITGDEGQLFLRAGTAPLGIGGNRYETGKRMQEKFHPDVFLLDDGFQHWRLARDLDIVLIDSLDPFGGAGLFPAGRLREPVESLARAGAFVLTRTQPGRRYTGIEAVLRRHNADAPLFRSRVVPRRWVDAVSGETYPSTALPVERTAAFCGLANPASFWQSLDEAGYRPVYRWSFGDHHVYRPQEIRTLVAQAQANRAGALLTTEKDLMNISAQALEMIHPLRLLWLEIGIEFENQAEIDQWLTDRLLLAGHVHLTKTTKPARTAPRPS